MLGNVQESKVNARVFGPNTLESFANYDPNTSSWKTSQLSWFEGSIPYSETWPRAGMMQSGISYRLKPLAPRISAKGSGLWPTPRALEIRNSDKHIQERTQPGRCGPSSLTSLVEMSEARNWPTPTARDGRSEGMIKQMRAKVEAGEISRDEAEQMIGGSLEPARMSPWPIPRTRGLIGGSGSIWMMGEKVESEDLSQEEAEAMVGTKLWPMPNAHEEVAERYTLETSLKHAREGRQVHLSQVVRDPRLWPTPRACDGKGSGKTGELRDRLDYAIERGGTQRKTYDPPQNTGKLNPVWVEWLMGYPLGWTALEDSATP